jgi:selenocysteine-specific translation elongation factor
VTTLAAANARDRAEPVKGVGIVALGFADDRQLEVIDERIVLGR